MKALLALALVFLSGLAAQARRPSTETCASLQKKADALCHEAMCEQAKEDGLRCERDGDYWEGHQICANEEFETLLKKYNASRIDWLHLNCDN